MDRTAPTSFILFVTTPSKKYAKLDITCHQSQKQKQARKLQATLVPVRNYESLTVLLADGGEV